MKGPLPKMSAVQAQPTVSDSFSLTFLPPACSSLSPLNYLVILYSDEGAFISQQEFPGLDKLSPACSGTSTPRGNVLASHSPMSPESIKMTHRHRYGLRAGEGPLHRGKSGCQRSEPGSLK